MVREFEFKEFKLGDGELPIIKNSGIDYLYHLAPKNNDDHHYFWSKLILNKNSFFIPLIEIYGNSNEVIRLRLAKKLNEFVEMIGYENAKFTLWFRSLPYVLQGKMGEIHFTSLCVIATENYLDLGDEIEVMKSMKITENDLKKLDLIDVMES